MVELAGVVEGWLLGRLDEAAELMHTPQFVVERGSGREEFGVIKPA